MFILPADVEFSKEIDAWASKQNAKRMKNSKVVHNSRCIKKDNTMSEINPVTKTRECRYYVALIEDRGYEGNATCLHPSKNMPNINAASCYCCKKNTITLGYGYNGQGA